jgi:hypothetical protein
MNKSRVVTYVVLGALMVGAELALAAAIYLTGG